VPTYEYVCEACQHEFEEFQQISDAHLRVCPKCRKRKLRRKIGTGAAVLFKGSGFYQTDYRSKEYKEKAKSDSAPTPAACDAGKCATCPNAKKNGA